MDLAFQLRQVHEVRCHHVIVLGAKPRQEFMQQFAIGWSVSKAQRKSCQRETGAKTRGKVIGVDQLHTERIGKIGQGDKRWPNVARQVNLCAGWAFKQGRLQGSVATVFQRDALGGL